MSSDQVNGAPPPPDDPGPASEAARERKIADDEALPGLTADEVAAAIGAGAKDSHAVQKAEAVLDAQVRQVMGVMLRGLMVSAPGIDPATLLRSTARAMASLMCEAITGDLVPVLQVRAGFRKAFEETLKRMPVKQNLEMPKQSMTGPSRRA